MRNKSTAQPRPPRFALDQNFPQSILKSVLGRWVTEIEIVLLSDVDERLTRDHDDWQVILALHQLGLEGLISTDSGMIWVPEVVAMVEETKMSLVVTEETDNDPIIATGLLLFHLRHVARRHRPDQPQIWRLAARERRPIFKEHVVDVEDRTGRKLSSARALAAKRTGAPVLSKIDSVSQRPAKPPP